MTPATGGAGIRRRVGHDEAGASLGIQRRVEELNPDLDPPQHLPPRAARKHRPRSGASVGFRRPISGILHARTSIFLFVPKSKRFIKQLGASAEPMRLGTRFALYRITAQAVGKEHGNEDGGLFDLLDDLWRLCADVRIHWPRLRVDRGRDRWCRNQTGAVAIEGQRYQLVQR